MSHRGRTKTQSKSCATLPGTQLFKLLHRAANFVLNTFASDEASIFQQRDAEQQDYPPLERSKSATPPEVRPTEPVRDVRGVRASSVPPNPNRVPFEVLSNPDLVPLTDPSFGGLIFVVSDTTDANPAYQKWGTTRRRVNFLFTKKALRELGNIEDTSALLRLGLNHLVQPSIRNLPPDALVQVALDSTDLLPPVTDIYRRRKTFTVDHLIERLCDVMGSSSTFHMGSEMALTISFINLDDLPGNSVGGPTVKIKPSDFADLAGYLEAKRHVRRFCPRVQFSRYPQFTSATLRFLSFL